MKKLHIILTMAFLLSGCALEEIRGPVTKTESKAFSIEDAKEFFEKDFAVSVTKTSSDGRKHGKLHPGDFTPMWDKAVYSEKGDYAAYDVSIITDRRIIASRGKDTDAKTVRVYQKLVVTQDTSSGKMTAYIMSLIPDNDQGHFPKSFSSRKNYRGNYSGIVVYTTVDSGALVRVQEYKNGELYRGVYLASGEDSYVERCRKAVEILKGIKLTSKRLITTKSGEDWDEPWDDPRDDPWDDTLDDGDLDMQTIAPGGVTDDNGEEE